MVVRGRTCDALSSKALAWRLGMGRCGSMVRVGWEGAASQVSGEVMREPALNAGEVE
jgi:hypothetical protein